MNIYYLKKFRKKAKEVVTARCSLIELCDDTPYVCYKYEMYIDGSLSKDLFELKSKLSRYRRDYILELAKNERKKKLNEQLEKL